MHAAFTPTYGPAHVIELRELPEPSCGPSQIVVEVHAAPVTKGDLRLRAGDFPGITAIFGKLLMGWSAPKAAVQGSIFAGRIVEIGADVRRFAVGDEVFGCSMNGAYAERLVMDADGPVALRPAGVDADEAAATQYGAGTALHFLRTMADVQPGERVLVLGGSGGVGRFAIQIAKHLGARVTAVGSRKAFPLMERLGADALLDYRDDDVLAGEYDVIFDVVHAYTFPQVRGALAGSGRYLTLGGSLSAMSWMLWTKLFGGQKAMFTVAVEDRESVEAVAEGLEAGWLSPVIAARYPLARIGDAHAHAEGERHGTVVVQPAERPGMRVVA